MKQKGLKRKTCSLLLAAAMILTSFPVSGKEARAAGTSDHSLSVTAFATKEQLMDETFAPDGDGKSSTIGKLAFGKNQAPNLEGTVVEWYILGKDDGVLGGDGETTENTVLFATVRIGKSSPRFNENTSRKSYDTGWGCVYKDIASELDEVYANHYGGSNLRKELNAIAEDTECFTTAEQALMNETTVTTYDTKAGANYTTTDKLYALNSEINGVCKTITAGTNDQIALAMDTYWRDNNDVDFWLRAPDQTYPSRARVADTGYYVVNQKVNDFYPLVPAFNLNLSSVIFASAAKAASSGNTEAGTIEDGTAMTLRLDGSDEKIGTVVYDEATGNIMAQKDTDATETVSLVVQGNDGTKDWYYSVPAGGETVVTKEQIQIACGISGDISLADCKIWLETTIDNVAYARMAKAATPVMITGSDQTLTYDVSAIDVSTYFSIDKNAGTPTYSLVTESGVTTGTGNLSGKELTVTKIGVFKVKLTTAAQGIYLAGEKTITLTITGKSLTDDMVTIASGPHYYTGSAVKPAVTVQDGSKTLVSGTDYTVSYKNNTNVGTATVTVAGKGNYTGTIEKTFDIILTDADQVAAAKRVVVETLEGMTATNGTTKQEIQDKIDTALTNAGISDVTVTVGDIAKTEATTSVEGSVSGSISITKGSALDSVEISKTIEKLPKTEAEKVADAKKVVEETLEGMTATNSTTKQEIQDRINTALTQAGITGVTVTVGDLSKTDATTDATGNISGSVSIQCGSETESVSISKSIAKLPTPDDDKVAAAKTVVQETLAGITVTNSTTKQEIQGKIDTALSNAGLSDVTVTVGDLTKTEATTESEGSISGSITIVSKNDSSVTGSVLINKTIERLELPVHTHTWTWIITKEATADEEGEMTGTCICGEGTTETIPKTGESESGTVIVKDDAENECNGVLEDKEDVKGKVYLTDIEKEKLSTGEDLVIILRLRDVDVAVDTQEKTEIQNKLETNTLGTFLDIELLKQIGGTETKITETTEEIKITFEIPEHIRNTDDTVTRTYQIMRNHDGVVDILDVENYDETAHLLTFKTDKFSTYALVYRDDVKSEPEPTPGATDTPGTPAPTPGTTGTPTPTPGTTDTPVTPTATPGATDIPGTPAPTPGTTDPAVVPTATPGTTATPDQPKPGTTPETVSEEQTVSKEIVEKNELSLNARLKVSQTGKKINTTWGKVEGADGYDVYVQYCGKKFTKKSITAIKSGMITKVTVKKVNGKPLKLKKNYKIYILAYKLVDGKKVTLGKTITAHIVGRKNTKYTNVKAVKVKKRSYSLKRGRAATIKASTVLVSKGKKQLTDAHAKEFRYATDNKEVATVSRKGKIKAVGKGSCTIYVYARNGYAKKIKIKVKK